MEINENIAGLGKDHDKEARDRDLAKKQSEAQHAAENLDQQPNSVNKQGGNDFLQNTNDSALDDTAQRAKAYAAKEHEKAENWDNRSTHNH